MAKKNSPGCGTVIIGLIVLAMAAKYWYVLVAIGFVASVIWGIVKLTQNWSTLETPDKNLELQGVTVTTTITDTHALFISGSKTNTPVNQQLPKNRPELLAKPLDRNNANTKVDQVNAVIEKDLTKEKVAAEVAMKIINRLGATLVDTEIQRILDAKKAALQERVAQVDTEIEKVLAAEKKEQINNRLLVVLDSVKTQRIIDAEKTTVREPVAQVHAEIERILATEKAAVSAAGAAEKSTVEVALKQKTAEEIEQIDNLSDVVLAPIETQWILDSEDMGMPKRVVQETAEIEQVLENEKTVASVVVADTSKKENEKCDLCKATGLHNILRLDPHCIGCEKKSQSLKSGSNITSAPIITVSATTFDTYKKEVTEDMKLYDFVFTNELEMLKSDDQWFEETTYFMLRIERGVYRPLTASDLWFTETTVKRGMREDAAKPHEWLLPFLPLEVAKLNELKQLRKWGPNLSSTISKPLRVQIRERRKTKQPYDTLLRALYSSCVLADFAKSLSFEGTPINIMARHVDIRELRNICIDYSTMGYRYIEALLKTDVKWLVEAFGEPVTHRSFDAVWPHIRQNAISRYCWEELRRENERLGFAQTTMVNWFPKLVNRNQWLAQNKVWLENKYGRKVKSAGQSSIIRPVEVAKPKGYAVPAPPIKPESKISLDMNSIETKLAETAAISAILKDIFIEDVPLPPQTAVSDSTTTEASIAGLDAESFSFMQALASKHIWARDELEKLAGHHSLMLDGTLDSINDASYDHFGGPFFEGDNPIEINTEFAKEIAA